MGKSDAARNRDQEIPARSGEEMGDREPLAPQPDEETDDRGRKEEWPGGDKPPVED
jgi:hypothetical protein